MSLVHSIIVGNLIMIGFNLIGFAAQLRAPPFWMMATSWAAVIAAIYVLSNP
jgi:hypothetical protein